MELIVSAVNKMQCMTEVYLELKTAYPVCMFWTSGAWCSETRSDMWHSEK